MLLYTRYVSRTTVHFYPFKCCHNCSTRQECKLSVNLYNSDNSYPTPKDPILNKEVFFVVYHAFYLKLSKHKGVFKKTLLPKLFVLRQKMENGFKRSHHEYLLNTLGTALPDNFKAIKI